MENHIEQSGEEPATKHELTVRLNQRTQVGMVMADNAEPMPIVLVELEMFAHLRSARVDARPAFEATGRYHATFDALSSKSRDETLAYVSSTDARNLALQAIALAHRHFREQLRLMGLNPDRIVFQPIGEFEPLPKAAAVPAASKPSKKRTSKKRANPVV